MSDGPDDATIELANRMFDMAREGDTDTLAAYVDAGVPVDLTNAKGDTLLILAAYHEHGSTVDGLLGRGADVDRTNDRGQTALVAAVFKGATPIVRALLAAGADPTAGGPSAIDTARFFEHPEILEMMERGG